MSGDEVQEAWEEFAAVTGLRDSVVVLDLALCFEAGWRLRGHRDHVSAPRAADVSGLRAELLKPFDPAKAVQL